MSDIRKISAFCSVQFLPLQIALLCYDVIIEILFSIATIGGLRKFLYYVQFYHKSTT